MISDTSSTVYEFLLLNKPVITFQTVAKDIYWIDIQQTDELPEAYDRPCMTKVPHLNANGS